MNKNNTLVDAIADKVADKLLASDFYGNGTTTHAATNEGARRIAAAGRRSAVKKGAHRRARGNTVEIAEKILAWVNPTDGYAVKDIATGIGAPLPATKAALLYLRKQGKIAMAGVKRFARYATTKQVATAAASAARTASSAPRTPAKRTDTKATKRSGGRKRAATPAAQPTA